MVYNFVLDMLGGVLPAAYGFIPYVISGLLLFVFCAVILNLFMGAFASFFFKS